MSMGKTLTVMALGFSLGVKFANAPISMLSRCKKMKKRLMKAMGL